ncbi:TerB family tellurite resistance protein [Pelagibacterales bacterium SAG-MED47]|nr:TerB family tellurite resistance protein [Pelagibacterales bacterium SAG-MED47]
MIFFKKDKIDKPDDDLIKITALLIHAAKIDENYTKKEEEIIKKAILKIGATNENIDNLLYQANKIEENSNQILDFTKEVKNIDNKKKIQIIETLWQIIYSNNEADMYETSLMRRLAGLLYIDNKIMGDIKDKIKKENS